MTLRSCSPLLAATTVTKPQPHSRSGSCLLTSWMRLQALSWEFALKPAKSFKIISTTTSGQRVETWWQLWHLRIVFFWGAFGKSITRQQPGYCWLWLFVFLFWPCPGYSEALLRLKRHQLNESPKGLDATWTKMLTDSWIEMNISKLITCFVLVRCSQHGSLLAGKHV